jgi:hypothetical protein
MERRPLENSQLHPFLGEGSPDDVPAQVFHGGLILGK